MYHSSIRQICCLNLFPAYEQIICGTFLGLAEKYAEKPPKGECVIVIGGAPDEKRVGNEKIRKFILSLTEEGIGVKTIVKMTSEIFDIPKTKLINLPAS